MKLTKRSFELSCAVVALACSVTCVRLGAQAHAPPSQQPAQGASGETAARTLPNVYAKDAASADQSSQTSQERLNRLLATTSACGVKGAIGRFHQAVRERKQGLRSEPLRILWFGDSHTAADFWPGAVRKALSSMLPLAGPGYLPLGVAHSRHGMARLAQQGAIDLSPHPLSRRSPEGDGVFGLGGTRATLKDSTAAVTVKLAYDQAEPQSMYGELYFRATERTDRLVLALGSDHREFGVEDASQDVGGISILRFEFGGHREFSLRSIRGTPQVFGVVAETNSPGFVIDTLGINGARLSTFLSWDRSTHAALVEYRRPLVAVIAYGTNEVFDDEKASRHATRLRDVVERLREVAPTVGCIVAGPTDTDKGGEDASLRAAEIDQVLRSEAERLGCGYFSPYELMKSDGGAHAWRNLEPPLGAADGIHLTSRGYARLGEAFVRQCFGGDAS